jgi:hypothetical protein
VCARGSNRALLGGPSTYSLDSMTSVGEAISDAEALLSGIASPEGALDPRWKAIIRVANFIPDHPEEVWGFISRWGIRSERDLKSAVATCALEHLLELHFDAYFPKVAALARSNLEFAGTTALCWKLGQAERPANAAAFDALIAEVKNAV